MFIYLNFVIDSINQEFGSKFQYCFNFMNILKFNEVVFEVF